MNLYEYFNTSNQTSPSAERHQNFVIDLRPPGCLAVQVLPPKARCDFIKSTVDCSANTQFLNYNYIHYCVIGTTTLFHTIVGIAFMIIMCVYLFYFTSSVSGRFFCPSVTALKHRFGISEHLAGITLVAYANHLPDLIKNLLLIDEDLSTLYSEIMGSSSFVTIFIGGVILFLKPFHGDKLIFTRDIGFHILAINFLDLANRSGNLIHISESICIMGIYVVYIIVIIIDTILVRRSQSYWRRLSIITKFAFNKPSNPKSGNFPLPVGLLPTIIDLKQMRQPEEQSLLRKTYDAVKPFTSEEWRSGGTLTKAWLIFKFPVDVILNLMLPIVDHELPLHGWSRLLNCVQIITFPLMVLFVGGLNTSFFGYRTELLVLIITVPIAIVIFFVTSTNDKPKYHVFFVFFSIFGALYLMKTFSKELMNIGDLIGYVTYSTQSFLGVTILIWGNCAGALAALVAFVGQGYQKMAYASTIGGPIFASTMSIGVIYFYKCLQSPTLAASFSQGSMGENCTIIQIIYLIVFLLGSSTTNFRLRKSLGFYTIIVYTLFVVLCFLGEKEFIHPFGTNHAEDYGADFL